MNTVDVNSSVQDRWNQNAEAWAAQIRRGEDVYRHEFLEPAFMSFMGEISGLDVLDAGCGEGTSSRFLALAGARVQAVDLTSNMIANARALEKSQPLGVMYTESSAADMPFESGTFDLVTSWMAFSDMACYADAVKDCARVLKVGGRLVFCVRHPSYFTRRMAIVRKSQGQPPFLLVGDYFSKKPWLESWAFSGGKEEAEGKKTFSNLRFPFTLSDCINGVVNAGLRLDAIQEPAPDHSLCVKHPRLAFWAEHAALYLFVSATKLN